MKIKNKTSKNTRIEIVIVNYRTPVLTVDCLRSLEDEVEYRQDVHVTVVEGGSGDNSYEQIQEAVANEGWGSWVKVVPLEKNGGFAYANNFAIRQVLDQEEVAEYIWLLNPDTYTVGFALTPMVDWADNNPNAGIIGSRLENPDYTPRFSAFRFMSAWSEFESTIQVGCVSRLLKNKIVNPALASGPVEAQWLSGASMLIRTEVFKEVGLLDDEYFMYYEETDFCLRAQRNNWKCWHLPNSRVVHLVGQSSGVTGNKKNLKRRPAYWFESRHRYFRKNYGILKLVLADLAWIAGYTICHLKTTLKGEASDQPPRLGRDFIVNSISLLKKGIA